VKVNAPLYAANRVFIRDLYVYLGYTPIMIAAFRNQLNIVLLLLAYGANADTPDLYGWTPLLLCAGNDEFFLIY
jgi:ankyrin repeat protein